MRKNIVTFLSLFVMATTVGVAEEEKSGAADQSQKTIKGNGLRHTDEFTILAIEYAGTKIWVPGTLVVKKGDNVKITLLNNIKSEPSTHGYAIDAFGIKEVIARGEPKTVTFTADRAGIFTIYCHQHPKHIGGQLLVLE